MTDNMTDNNMSDAEREAYEVARSRGWDHADYVSTYGGDMDAPPEIPERFASVDTSLYLSGWEEGVSNYKDGAHEDGSSRD